MQYYRTQFRRDLLTVVLSSALARLEDPWDFSEQELDLNIIISIKKTDYTQPYHTFAFYFLS